MTVPGLTFATSSLTQIEDAVRQLQGANILVEPNESTRTISPYAPSTLVDDARDSASLGNWEDAWDIIDLVPKRVKDNDEFKRLADKVVCMQV